jgi:hypothetical protein
MDGDGIYGSMINNKLKFGSSIDYGDLDLFDDNGYFVKTYNAWESSSGFAFGMNLLDFIGEMKNNEEMIRLQPYTEFSIGYNLNFIKSSLDSDFTGYTHTDGLGVIFRLSPLNELNYANHSYIKTDIVISSYFRNISKTNIDYGNRKQPVAYSRDIASSCKTGLGIENLQFTLNPGLYDLLSIFCQDIISVKLLTGISRIDDSYDVSGYGVEFSLFDFLSIRNGDYYDINGDNSGKTFGWGLNIKYYDLVQFQFNYAEFPGGILQNVQTRSDFMLNVNLLELFRNKE